MTTLYTDGIKQQAFKWYMESGNLSEVARRVRKIVADGKCSAATIKLWVRKGGWKELRNEAQALATTEIAKEGLQSFLEIEREQLDTYREVTKAGKGAIAAPIRSGESAARVIDIGIRGERGIMMSGLALEFINRVAQVIREEVIDEELRLRIYSRLKAVAREEAEKTT